MKNTKNYNTLLLSPHSIEECHRRLKEAVDTTFFPIFSSKQVIGSITKDRISIRKRIRYQNSFQAVLKSSYTSNGTGTVFKYSIGLHPFVKLFMFVWFGLLILIGGSIVAIAFMSLFVNKVPADTGIIMGIIIPIGLAIFGIALLKFSKYLAKDEPKFLKRFLVNLLNAKEIEQVEPGA